MWLALGRSRIINVDGRLRYFDPSNGVWKVCKGLFPEGMYSEIRPFMNRLEGMFRSLDKATRREVDSILKSMGDLLEGSTGDGYEAKECKLFETFEHASVWNKGTREQEVSDEREGSDAEANEESEGEEVPSTPARRGPNTKEDLPWQTDVAINLRSFGKKLIYELMQGGTVVKNFTEWCGTSVIPTRGVCYLDRAVKYDVPTVFQGRTVLQPLGYSYNR